MNLPVPFPVIRLLLLMLMIFSVSTLRAQQREVPDSVTARLKKEKVFRYANDPSFWQEKKPARNYFGFLDQLAKSPVLKWVAYLLTGAFIVFILYQVIVVNNFFLFSRSARKKKKIAILGEEVDENTDDKIDEAISNGHYRVAVRFLFLKTLRLLHDRNQIRLHARATNHDYRQQMNKLENGSEFRTLTHLYEYVWYGEFHPSEAQFEFIYQDFKQFISRY